jgi:hypothetical protein
VVVIKPLPPALDGIIILPAVVDAAYSVLSVTEVITMSHREICTETMTDWLEKVENRQDAADVQLEKMVFHWLNRLVVGNAYRSEQGRICDALSCYTRFLWQDVLIHSSCICHVAESAVIS